MAAIYRTVSGASNVHILHIVTWQPLRPMRLAAPRSMRRRGGALRDRRACRGGRRARGPKQGLGVAWQEERRGGRRRLREQDGHEGGERVHGNASRMYTPGGRACVPRRGDAFSPSPPFRREVPCPLVRCRSASRSRVSCSVARRAARPPRPPPMTRPCSPASSGGGSGTSVTQQLSRGGVQPANPDIVWVGAQGHAFGPNAERGVYKTTDGGKTWNKVLFRNDSTGISDLVLDPSNPDVLYAAFWQAQRKPWQLVSGGPGGGIF